VQGFLFPPIAFIRAAERDPAARVGEADALGDQPRESDGRQQFGFGTASISSSLALIAKSLSRRITPFLERWRRRTPHETLPHPVSPSATSANNPAVLDGEVNRDEALAPSAERDGLDFAGGSPGSIVAPGTSPKRRRRSRGRHRASHLIKTRECLQLALSRQLN
jgi:hypothetical protein